LNQKIEEARLTLEEDGRAACFLEQWKVRVWSEEVKQWKIRDRLFLGAVELYD